MLVNLKTLMRFSKLSLVGVGILWGLSGLMYSCTTSDYVRDGLTESFALQEGFISPNVYQFWYKDTWDNQGYYVKGLQEPNKGAKGVRFIDLVQGARAKVDEREIKSKIENVFSRLACGSDNKNVLSELLSAGLEYRVLKEEYYFNGVLYWLIRIRAEGLEDLGEELSC